MTTPTPTSDVETLAAVDLGSNSFHMVIARVRDGQLQVIDRIRDMVRLGAGLDADNNLTDEAQDNALRALSRFGERLRGMPEGTVRIVGTNTLRQAKNAAEFMAEAEEALGHPIEIISGREEGRLIYLGVSHDIALTPGERCLVIDIGGGSTEFIIGQGSSILACESLYMGCVSYSQRFFPKGRITNKRFDRAVLAARQEVRVLETVYPALGWQIALGASGTIRAIQSVLQQEKMGGDHITLDGLQRLRQKMVALGHADMLKLEGLNDNRAPVFAGGVAILLGAFQSLGIERMSASEFALREGVLYDLYGRRHHADIRDQTIDAMAARYQVDKAHADRVERTALGLHAQLAEAWGLDDMFYEQRLRWACQLHEIGLAVAHSRYHKHGSYLVENSDMPGFSRQDQQIMWALVRTHRRSFKPHRFMNIPNNLGMPCMRLAVILRLAVLLNRARSQDAAHELRASAKGNTIKLRFPPNILAQSPLMAADLEAEAEVLETAGFKLRIR
jgi:exopolyphosphatase/guanosine-5'-triphosphate,3'-diphosphate pyrophosphatase